MDQMVVDKIVVPVPFTLPTAKLLDGNRIIIEQPNLGMSLKRCALLLLLGCGVGGILICCVYLQSPQIVASGAVTSVLAFWTARRYQQREKVRARPRILGTLAGQYYIGRLGSTSPSVTASRMKLTTHRTTVRRDYGLPWEGWSVVAWVADQWMMLATRRDQNALAEALSQLPDWVPRASEEGPPIDADGYLKLF